MNQHTVRVWLHSKNVHFCNVYVRMSRFRRICFQCHGGFVVNQSSMSRHCIMMECARQGRHSCSCGSCCITPAGLRRRLLPPLLYQMSARCSRQNVTVLGKHYAVIPPIASISLLRRDKALPMAKLAIALQSTRGFPLVYPGIMVYIVCRLCFPLLRHHYFSVEWRRRLCRCFCICLCRGNRS